jgi:hypothetical protein
MLIPVGCGIGAGAATIGTGGGGGGGGVGDSLGILIPLAWGTGVGAAVIGTGSGGGGSGAAGVTPGILNSPPAGAGGGAGASGGAGGATPTRLGSRITNSVAICAAAAVGGGGIGAVVGASATYSNSTAPSFNTCPFCSGLPVAGRPLMRVPLVEPRSVSVTTPPFISSRAWELDTEPSSSLKSLAKPRPTKFFPGFSSNS